MSGFKCASGWGCDGIYAISAGEVFVLVSVGFVIALYFLFLTDALFPPIFAWLAERRH